jgi:hypothetical protein
MCHIQPALAMPIAWWLAFAGESDSVSLEAAFHSCGASHSVRLPHMSVRVHRIQFGPVTLDTCNFVPSHANRSRKWQLRRKYMCMGHTL